jgi:hypothetical protein
MFTIILALLSLFIELGTAAVPKRDTSESFTALSSAQIEAFKPYSLYAGAAYCLPAQIMSWSCGGSFQTPFLSSLKRRAH